jgi:HAD superfamily hydrolase (TIGR01509 family)
MLKALIFDCDGVLVDTERDGHRIAFNRAFKAKGYNYEWDVTKYHDLLQIAGGKERMRQFFNEVGWPNEALDHDAFLREMHKLKTDLFMEIIESGELELRPGVARLVDEAIKEGLILAVCSTSNERAVTLIVEKLLGPKRRKKFSAIFAGDVVSKKKPDPEIYNLALKKLALTADECVVVEDSRNGLLAAKAANMTCIVTTNGYTERENTTEGDLVVPELGDAENINVSIKTLRELVK